MNFKQVLLEGNGTIIKGEVLTIFVYHQHRNTMNINRVMILTGALYTVPSIRQTPSHHSHRNTTTRFPVACVKQITVGLCL